MNDQYDDRPTFDELLQLRAEDLADSDFARLHRQFVRTHTTRSVWAQVRKWGRIWRFLIRQHPFWPVNNVPGRLLTLTFFSAGLIALIVTGMELLVHWNAHAIPLLVFLLLFVWFPGRALVRLHRCSCEEDDDE